MDGLPRTAIGPSVFEELPECCSVCRGGWRAPA